MKSSGASNKRPINVAVAAAPPAIKVRPSKMRPLRGWWWEEEEEEDMIDFERRQDGMI
jgi:hypothetical protein